MSIGEAEAESWRPELPELKTVSNEVIADGPENTLHAEGLARAAGESAPPEVPEQVQGRPIVDALKLWGTDPNHSGTGYSPFLVAAYQRAKGKQLRPLTADMIEQRLVNGELPEDPILALCVHRLFVKERETAKDAKRNWQDNQQSVNEDVTVRGQGAAVDYAEPGAKTAPGEEAKENTGKEKDKPQEPLDFKERMLHIIYTLRVKEKQRADEIRRKQDQEVKKLREAIDEAHETSTRAEDIEDITEEPTYGQIEDIVLTNSASAEDLDALWSLEVDADKLPDESAPNPEVYMYMPLNNLKEEERNSSEEAVDPLAGYPGLLRLRQVLVESTYDWIARNAGVTAAGRGADFSAKQEMLRNRVEEGVDTILISTIINPNNLRRAEDPPLLVDAAKLQAFQDGIKKFGESEANCPSLYEIEELAAELERELAALPEGVSTASIIPGAQRWISLSTNKSLSVTSGYKSLKKLLFTFETLVTRDGRGAMQLDMVAWSEKAAQATMYGGVLAICAITQILERQGVSEAEAIPKAYDGEITNSSPTVADILVGITEKSMAPDALSAYADQALLKAEEYVENNVGQNTELQSSLALATLSDAYRQELDRLVADKQIHKGTAHNMIQGFNSYLTALSLSPELRIPLRRLPPRELVGHLEAALQATADTDQRELELSSLKEAAEPLWQLMNELDGTIFTQAINQAMEYLGISVYYWGNRKLPPKFKTPVSEKRFGTNAAAIIFAKYLGLGPKAN